MTENEIGRIIVDCSFRLHKQLGPGLLESVYQECLLYELRRSGLQVQKEACLPLVYNEVRLDCGYRLDLLVESKVLIEVKSVEMTNDVYLAQVLTYLKLSGCKLGFLINFNVSMIKDGIRRVVNHL